jgi:shikimate kinase
LVERVAGKSVPEIFAAEGEAGFRHREVEAVRAAARGPRSVISLGGGALVSRAVRLAVRKTGHLVWLRAAVALCAERAASGRPLLAGNPAARLEGLAAARLPIYERLSDAVAEMVPGLSPQQLAAQVASMIVALEAQRAHG